MIQSTFRMRSLQRRLLLLTGTGALVGGAWVAEGCSQTPPQLFSPDTGLPVFVFDSAPPPVVYADGGPQPVRIVAGSLGGPEASALVVFHDASGSVTGTTMTNSDGYAESLLPAGSGVSVLLGNVNVAPSVVTYLGVQPGDLLVAYDPSVVPNDNALTITDVPSGAPGGSVDFNALTGSNCGSGYFTGSMAMPYPLYTGCLSPLAQFPVLVEALDINATQLGFVFSKNQTLNLDAGATVDLADASWSTMQGMWTVNVLNGSSNPEVTFTEVASTVPLTTGFFDDQLMPDGGFSPGTFVTHVGYSDFVQSEANVQSSNEVGTTFTAIATRSLAPMTANGSVTLDLSQLPPTIDTETADWTTKPAQPTVTFQPGSPINAPVGTVVVLTWYGQSDAGQYTNATWTIVAPPNLTTITAPVLPASAVGWTPTNEQGNETVTVTVMSGDGITGYDQFRQFAGVMPPPNYDYVYNTVVPLLPMNGTLTLTVVGPYIE